MKRNNTLLLLIFTLSVLGVSNSCKHENDVSATDILLYELATRPEGFSWYKHADSLFSRSAGSGHSEPFLRTRYNEAAATQLGADGKILTDAVFPEGSLIVKELFTNTTTIGRYAILYKQQDSPDADGKGWVWGYINADGSVAESSANKGNACIGCHSQSGNISYMLMNKYFP